MLFREKIIPFDAESIKNKGEGFFYKGKEFIHHSTLDLKEIAFHKFSGLQIFLILLFIFLLSLSFYFNWHTTIIIFVALLTIVYFADLLFNFFLIIRSFIKDPEIKVSEFEIKFHDNKDWPTYTIFCPLYKEGKVLNQFIKAMEALDYPKEKLEIMLLLEEDDKETIDHAKSLNLPKYFKIVVVPDSYPKTKPKACNYGLKFATGKYTVIFDAEDIPDPLQLKKAVIAFGKTYKNIVCVQAKLNFYNPHQNLLTRVFTAEYSLWFDLVLTGLQSVHAPIPLGGTSNHFLTSKLRELKGWDSFNVTEDCDLGIRLLKKGYRTAVMDSITLEEANSSPSNWFWQRTRWIKGYMQTYLVHMRRPGEFFQSFKNPHLLTFQFVVGGKIISMFINPFMWIVTILYFAFRAHVGTFIESFFPTPVLYMGVFSLFAGNFLYAYYYMIGCAKHGHHELVKFVFLVPFYWLWISLAAWIATYKLFFATHHWSKTKHGLHLDNKQVIENMFNATHTKTNTEGSI